MVWGGYQLIQQKSRPFIQIYETLHQRSHQRAGTWSGWIPQHFIGESCSISAYTYIDLKYLEGLTPSVIAINIPDHTLYACKNVCICGGKVGMWFIDQRCSKCAVIWIGDKSALRWCPYPFRAMSISFFIPELSKISSCVASGSNTTLYPNCLGWLKFWTYNKRNSLSKCCCLYQRHNA